MNDREMDAWLAEAMGYEPVKKRGDNDPWDRCNIAGEPRLFRPSAVIGDAWQIVEKIGQWRGFEFMLTRQNETTARIEAGWKAGWIEWDQSGFEWRVYGEDATSAPRAICLAALAALGVEAPR